MKFKCFILILTSALNFSAYGQTARFSRNGTLVLSDGSHRIQFHDISEPVDHVPTAPCVHAVQKRNNEYFMVVTTSRWTRGYPPRGGAGGCGEEAYVKWLHVVGGKVTDSKEGRFQSWSDNREGHVDGWTGFIFTVMTDDLLEDRVEAKDKEAWQKITYTYDSRHPENGIKEDKGQPHE